MGALDTLRNHVVGPITKGLGGKYHVLPDMLSVAVPLWQLEFRELTHDERSAIAQESLDTLMRCGEAIIHRIEGKTAEAFNALARGIACLSFVPGGVECFGQHFETKQ
jgi:hypothetical protein